MLKKFFMGRAPPLRSEKNVDKEVDLNKEIT